MRVSKYIILFLLIILMIPFFPNSSFAKDDEIDPLDTIVDDMKNVNNVTETGTQVQNVFNAVIKLIQIVGSGISLIVVTLTGIKYMTASAGEKADLKKQAVPIVIGCVLLFAGSTIAGIVANLGNKLN